MKPRLHRLAAGAPPPRKLSEELTDLLARLGTRPVTLREVIYVLRGRAYTLLLILLSLPFLTPLPLPGLSTPLGLMIAFIALRLALGQRPWLPRRLQRKELPAEFFAKVFRLSARVIRVIETFLRPRLAVISTPGALLRVHALVMLLAALALMLPLPIPLSNSLPAWTILLLAAGMLERDGLFILIGHGMFLLTVLYFVVLGEAAEHLAEIFLHWLTG